MTNSVSLLWLSKNLTFSGKSGASTFTLKKYWNAGGLFKDVFKQTPSLEHYELIVFAKKFKQEQVFIYMWICHNFV